MRFSSWWDETAWDGRLRVDLAEVMDELDPGWAAWKADAAETPAVA
ncbi:MAG: hypothetical protein M3279_00895 [Actinomycetota bacterium]|nr:hypothetical protein [Actinomycetota bacterium]